MNKKEQRNWIINIENCAAEVSEKYGSVTVKSVFHRYGAHDLHDLNPCYYSEVFADLEQMRND